MPWQQYVADVLLEVDPDTGDLWYTEAGLEVPRQSGKSTFIMSKATHRCTATGFFGPRQRVVYTAQTRLKAREKWDEDYRQELEASATFKRMARPFKGAGNEHFRFQNGSKWGIDANTESAGHGGTIDEAYIDEAFAQKDGRLEQAFRPAMITRRNKQFLWISTAGWLDEAPFLWDKTLLGRAAVENPESRLAYFEWSAPDDADPRDPETWRACMPALGHTITEAAIRGELDGMKLPDFRRAYLNQWVPKPIELDESPIPVGLWSALADPEGSALELRDLTLAIDMPPDRSSASIVACGRRPDGTPQVEVVETGPGSGWVAERCARVASKRWIREVVVDSASAAAALVPDLEAQHLTVHKTTTREYAEACGGLFDAVVQSAVRNVPHPAMAQAISGATKRPLGDAWAFDKRKATVDITPLVAAALARWAVARTREASPEVYVI